MKKVKVVIWLLVFGFLALVIFQNEDYFLNTQQQLRLNLYFLNEYHSPSLPLAVFHLLFFCCGVVVAYAMSAAGRFRSHTAVKRLQNAAAAQEKELLSLKTELARQKGEPLAPAQGGPAGESSITSPIKPA
jgi:uncharacterized integral membrane protein